MLMQSENNYAVRDPSCPRCMDGSDLGPGAPCCRWIGRSVRRQVAGVCGPAIRAGSRPSGRIVPETRAPGLFPSRSRPPLAGDRAGLPDAGRCCARRSSARERPPSGAGPMAGCCWRRPAAGAIPRRPSWSRRPSPPSAPRACAAASARGRCPRSATASAAGAPPASCRAIGPACLRHGISEVAVPPLGCGLGGRGAASVLPLVLEAAARRPRISWTLCRRPNALG